jgi:glutamine synthetase
MTEQFDLSDISWVRLSFVDVFGVSHSMQIPAARFTAAVKNGEPFDGSSLEGRARLIETDMRLLPDPQTLICIEDGVARAVCIVLDTEGEPWAGDPRTTLAMVADELGELATDYTVSPELEFYLFDDDGEPVDTGGYFQETESIGMEVVRAAADRLTSYGVEVDSAHHEAGPGQYEIDLAPLPPIEAADALVLTKQVLREEASRADVEATFMPRPLPDQPGSGLHVHQRVGSLLVDEDGTLTEEGRRFVAGQLEHARALSALAAPTVNSYKRLHSGPEAPGAIVWAHVNRGALIKPSPDVTGGSTIEFRGADPSANPYLLFAGLLVAAAHGLGSGLELPPAFEEALGTFDPAAVDSTRSELLPRDLEEALDSLLADDVMVDAFDGPLLGRLVDGGRADIEAYSAQVTPWELARYFDEA